MIHRNRLKTARTLLGLSQAEVCEKAGISIVTIRRVESETGYAEKVSDETIERVRRVLEDHGIVFLDTGDVSPGPGVALRTSQPGR